MYNLFSVTKTKLIFQYNYYVFHYAVPMSPIVSYTFILLPLIDTYFIFRHNN